MASDTAWMVGLTAPGLPDAHTSYGNALAKPHLDADMFPDWAVISPRALSQPINDLRGLGIEIDENNAVLKGLRSAVLTGYSLYMLTNAVAALRRAEQLAEAGWATGETITLAIFQQWGKILMGIISAAAVYSSFKVGGVLGADAWHLEGFDLTDPIERRRATAMVNSTIQGW